MQVEELIAKVQSLISGWSIGVDIDQDRAVRQIVAFRDTFRHKCAATVFHIDLIRKTKREIERIIAEELHNNHELLMVPRNTQRALAFERKVRFQFTCLLEDAIHHLLSAFENLPKIISVFQSTVSSDMSLKAAKKQLSHEHTIESKVAQIIIANWDWIGKIKDFRGKVFHHHSQTARVSMELRMNRNQLGVAEYFERIIVSVPHSLKDALGYSDSEVEIEQFTQGLIDKSFEFFASLLDILIEMHAQRIANKQ